ncbi:MAG: hypothetical protein HYR94_23080 [Chloroflexi bacterium]|nr:hypothetical protein [Chloroflexota bacterium]
MTWIERKEEVMISKKPNLAQIDTLPENFDSFEAFWEFWDTHSSADYEDVMEPVEVEIELSSDKMYCPIAKDLLRQVRTQARRQGVSTETLVNLWLQEKLLELA